jgi:uncharacterized repeat protein (TIGR04076 family)
MKPVRIRVIAKHFYKELANEYLSDGEAAGSCPLHEVGQEFLYEGGAVMPEGFCPWAWIDVYRTVSALSSGATHKPWNNRDGQSILCCSDGIRPVIFEITALG